MCVCLQEDGQAGIQELGGNATLLFYQTAEGEEGRRAFLEKRPPDFSKFPGSHSWRACTRVLALAFKHVCCFA